MMERRRSQVDVTRLRFGPYSCPQAGVGEALHDELLGPVTVGGWTSGRVPWPRRSGNGYQSLILCGDLVRAVKEEAGAAIEYWWGVSGSMVARWRKALGVPKLNPGGLALAHERHAWPAAALAMLGTAVDARVAAKLGRSEGSVVRKRLALGIPAFGKGGEPDTTPIRPSMGAKLKFGPYSTPAVRVGDWIDDEIDGRVEVGGWRDTAPIPWPRRAGRESGRLILCGDLVRAVRQEQSQAIQYWWGVSSELAAVWRAALGVPRMTAGRRVVLDERRAWPASDLALLGTGPDAEIAAKVGRDVAVVSRKRTALNIRAVPSDRWWSPEEDALLGEMSDEELADALERSLESVRIRRIRLGIPKPGSMAWLLAEIQLLGTMHDD